MVPVENLPDYELDGTTSPRETSGRVIIAEGVASVRDFERGREAERPASCRGRHHSV